MDDRHDQRRPGPCAARRGRSALARFVATARRMRCAVLPAIASLAAACATYHPLPLGHAPHLVGRLSDLATELPAGITVARPGTDASPAAVARGNVARRIDTTRPLTLEDIGWLALLNDPDLAALRGRLDAAQADLLQASLLPNPSAGMGYQSLLGGPGYTGDWTASVTEDIVALITYHDRVEAARAAARQVSAQVLWDEWQVAEKARLTALDLYWDERSLRAAAREHDLFAAEVRAVRKAVAAGDLDASALAPLEAAQAAADQSLASLRLGELVSWQTLDALLGLAPDVRFPIARPAPQPLPAALDRLMSSLPQRRPDLIALQLGYRSSDRNVRAAILGQFPALALGWAWEDDTTNIRSGGVAASFDLPIFDRNQGHIAQARATRLLLHAQYQSRLDATAGEVRGLAAQALRLTADVRQAQRASVSAAALAASARTAYAQGNLDQRSLADYETAELDRELEAAALQRSRGEVLIALSVALALGLPETTIIPPQRGHAPPAPAPSEKAHAR